MNKWFYGVIIVLAGVAWLASCQQKYDYTTWQCQRIGGDEQISMLLSGSKMKFGSDELNFCGSLGSQSYFDMVCKSNIEASLLNFVPKTGYLQHQKNNYECKVL